jgi:hypothetical protein
MSCTDEVFGKGSVGDGLDMSVAPFRDAAAGCLEVG